MILDHLTETISAIATPQGVGGVSIIRISGASASTIVKAMTTLAELAPNTIRHSYINRDENEVIDEALVAWFSAPHSYTGEDIAEIQCHGGIVVARQILERTIELGARLAGPGEFTLRAFINGKMDLIKAESVIDLIEAKTEKATTIQAHHLLGDVSFEIKGMRDDLLSLVAHLEVHLDYPDEETLAPSERYIDRLNRCLFTFDRLLATFRTGRILQEGLLLAIIGKPNVGKSSLLNALLKESRVIVSDQPGTTRDAVEVWMKIASVPVRVVDTAGLHETSDVVEKMGMARSKDYLEKADLVLFVVDQTTGITPVDEAIIAALPIQKTISILNKVDQPEKKRCSLPAVLAEVVKVSAKTEQGLPALWAALESAVLSVVGETNSSQPVLTNVRQKEQLLSARIHILDAIKSLEEGLAEDFWLIGLRAALRDLSEILGQDVSEEVLSSIFSRFCVGK